MSKKGIAFSFLIKVAAIVFLSAGLLTAFLAYRFIYAPNVNTLKDNYLYIRTGSDYETVLRMLVEKDIIKNKRSFDWVARKKNYHNKVKPGRYRINSSMSNDALVNLLRSGMQEPVKVTFNNIRTKTELAGIIGRQLEADSVELLEFLNNDSIQSLYGFNSHTMITMFIPNTYEFYWTTNAAEFLRRMNREYKTFWNEDRTQKASNTALTPIQVSTLASIVCQETTKPDDKPVIAGVYINRLNKGIPLEADPTLKFAIGDFTIQRLLNADKEIDSPYNTYKNSGLPPGPICLPSTEDIDAVLNYQKHNYIFFCAREDFSGYSNFAVTYEEHLINARKYQQALNRLNIKR